MRIGCLQFAPQLGDFDENLTRADAVIAAADIVHEKRSVLDTLDLLVLPELAFSGHGFTSPDHATSSLESPIYGISSLWAQVMAMRHHCFVVVGYPERSSDGTKSYNSAVLVNPDGEPIANYRKHFLDEVDAAWASEGQGFSQGTVAGLGRLALGLSMDINPQRRGTPFHLFEFAFHVLDIRANLVVVTMAWQTGQSLNEFESRISEPDLQTLSYWITRLEPLIRAETRGEIVVIFCNRTGTGGGMIYAGTSAVLGINEGEVFVYGLLGRGESQLLVVDTNESPIAKLVARRDPFGSTSHPDSATAALGTTPSTTPISLNCQDTRVLHTQERLPLLITRRGHERLDTPIMPTVQTLMGFDDDRSGPSPTPPCTPRLATIPEDDTHEKLPSSPTSAVWSRDWTDADLKAVNSLFTALTNPGLPPFNPAISETAVPQQGSSHKAKNDV